MKTMKKALALALAVMMLALIPVNAFALTKEIDEIDISIDTRISDKCPLDYKDFVKINTEGVLFQDENFGDGYRGTWFERDNVEPDDNELFEAGKSYYVFIYIVADENYEFSDSPRVTINGKTVDPDNLCFYDDGYVSMEIYADITVEEPGFLQNILAAISNFFANVLNFIRNLFQMGK